MTRSSASSERIQSWRGQRCGEVLLVDISRPRTNHDPFCELSSNGDGFVRALGVDHNELVGPADRLERAAKILRFVPCDDGDRKLRHTGSLADGGRTLRLLQPREWSERRRTNRRWSCTGKRDLLDRFEVDE